ncbi:MAG: tetratricopeptide repeat protein [bacterium]
MPERNAYGILNLRKGASDQEIKQAYVDLVKKFDPERHTDRFMVIQNAFERLSDPQKRAKEDIITLNAFRGNFHFADDEKVNTSEGQIQMDLQRAEQALSQNTGNEPLRGQVIKLYMQLSWKNVMKKLWVEAIKEWQKVIELEPTHQRAKNNLLFSYLTLGYSYAIHDLFDEAQELWEKALQMNPDQIDLLHNLALLCEWSGQPDKSERYWSEVARRWKNLLDRQGDNEYLKNCLIELHKHLGGRALGPEKTGQTAIEEYKEILKLNPHDFEAQFQIARSHMEGQKWPEAIKELMSLHHAHPRNTEVLNLMGWAQLNGGQVDTAFNTWRKAMAIDPKNYTTRENIIKARLSVGKKLRDSGLHTSALVHLKELLKYLPDSSEVHFELGSTFLLKGDQRSAYQEFTRVLELDPKNKLARKALSEMRLRR